jgi:hypothetical protein
VAALLFAGAAALSAHLVGVGIDRNRDDLDKLDFVGLLCFFSARLNENGCRISSVR